MLGVTNEVASECVLQILSKIDIGLKKGGSARHLESQRQRLCSDET